MKVEGLETPYLQNASGRLLLHFCQCCSKIEILTKFGSYLKIFSIGFSLETENYGFKSIQIWSFSDPFFLVLTL